MLEELKKYLTYSLKVIIFNIEAIREAADDKWIIIPGLVFFLGAMILSLGLECSTLKDCVPGLARNVFSILVFVAGAMIWGGAKYLLRFIRVFALSHLGDLLFLFPVHLATQVVLPLYLIWCIAMYAVIYFTVLGISPLKAAITSMIAMFITIFFSWELWRLFLLPPQT